jgi:transposase
VTLEQVFVLLEQTGHYHKALEQHLLELDVSVYLVHVQKRQQGLLKTDKRDALGLANHLYNQLEKGIQVTEKSQLVRPALPPTEAASLLGGLIRHRYELIQESTQRKNKLTSICDELFPEFTQVFKDPNYPAALVLRLQFPTPQAVAITNLEALRGAGVKARGLDTKLLCLQQLACASIGTRDLGRQRGLVLEQTQLIKELQLMQQHLAQLEEEIHQIVARSREGQILTSIPPIGPLPAATLIAKIGHINNFPNAACLRAYCGWAPNVLQSGRSVDASHLGKGGNHMLKHTLFLIVWRAIRMDGEWAKLYERLVPRKCNYDERTQRYQGKLKVMGRLAGQMLSLIYGLLKQDTEVLAATPPGQLPPDPVLYDPAKHQAHRQGAYRPMKPPPQRDRITKLPHL